jgi:hypothetical protein
MMELVKLLVRYLSPKHLKLIFPMLILPISLMRIELVTKLSNGSLGKMVVTMMTLNQKMMKKRGKN